MDPETYATQSDDEDFAEGVAAAHHNTDFASDEEPPEDDEADAEPDDHADAIEGGETTRLTLAIVRGPDTDGLFVVGLRVGHEDDDRGVLIPPSEAIETAQQMMSMAQAAYAANALIAVFRDAGLSVEQEPVPPDEDLDDETRAKLEAIAAMFGAPSSLQD